MHILLPQGNGGMPDTELELLYHHETKLMDVRRLDSNQGPWTSDCGEACWRQNGVAVAC